MRGKIWELRRISIVNLTVHSNSRGSQAKEASVMTKTFLLFLIALICAPVALAQNRRDDYSSYEFYVGYAHERANNDADRFDRNGTAICNGSPVDFKSEKANYNGFEVEFNQNVTRHIGIVTQFTGTYDTPGYL